MADSIALPSAGAPLSLRNRLNRRWGAMKNERTSWDNHIRDVFEQTRPRRTRFTQTNVNQGDRRNKQIIDNTGVIASRVLVSGMVNGMSSPAQPWFKFEPQDLELLDYGPAKDWIEKLEHLVRRIFDASNVYQALPEIYEELSLAGTGCAVIEDDFQDVIRLSTFTWGEFCLALNERRVVDTLYREMRMTVLQCVQKFGLSNCSVTVQTQYNNSQYDAWVDVMHAIEPNNNRKSDKADQGNMAYRSIYWEPGANQTGDEKFLRKSGYRQCPIIAPRWDVIGNDVYGSSCPGMEALGDMRQLQIQQKRIGEGVDKELRPPTQGPASLADRFVATNPGNHTVTPNANAGGAITAIYQVNPSFDAYMKVMEACQKRVNEAFYVPYILSISQMEGVQPRNQWEISERKGEGLLVMGPVVQRLQNELFGPLMDRTLNRIYEVCMPLWQAGENAMIEPPPPELQGMPLRVQYISPLAQIQKQSGVSAIERLIQLVANPAMAQILPAAFKKIDGAQMVDTLADKLGIDGGVVYSDQEMEAMEAAEQQQAAQQQQMQALAASAKPISDAANAAKTLSDTPTGQGNQSALSVMLQNLRNAGIMGQQDNDADEATE